MIDKNLLLILFFAVHLGTSYSSEEEAPNIFAAVNANDIEAVRRIVEANPQAIHAQDCLRGTPLHWAAFHGYYGIVHYLIQHGADVNLMENWQETPLHWVVTQSPDKKNIHTVLALLIAMGGDIDVQNIRGITPVHKAAMRCYLRYIKQLLLAGAYVDTRDQHGRTPLFLTLKEEPDHWLESYRERCEVIKYLLKFGVSLDIERDLLRQCCLRYAVYDYDFALIISTRRKFWQDHIPALVEHYVGADYEHLQLPDDLRCLLLDFIATPALPTRHAAALDEPASGQEV